MKRAGFALAALALVPAAPASAQTPPTLKLSAEDVFGGSRPAALTGRSFTARVVMRPYVAGERVTVRAYRNGRKIQGKALTPKPVNGGTAAVATLKVKSGKPGRVLLRASHKATPALPTLRAKTVGVEVVRPSAGPGARGPAVRLLQSRLAAMHYAVPRSGVYDAGTGRAVMAWRKVAGMARTTIATPDVFAGLLKGRGTFKVRHPGDGRHIEARIDSQVLALVNGSRPHRIYHISSGAPATPTVRGKFRVYLKTPGTNAKGMVDSSYFIRGYAVHGYASVPPYNASHGCLRVPIPNARYIYDWLRMGDVVWVEG
jgi:peptidoglycan hydrolase-like protein with peptidoglycan-binding domain